MQLYPGVAPITCNTTGVGSPGIAVSAGASDPHGNYPVATDCMADGDQRDGQDYAAGIQGNRDCINWLTWRSIDIWAGGNFSTSTGATITVDQQWSFSCGANNTSAVLVTAQGTGDAVTALNGFGSNGRAVWAVNSPTGTTSPTIQITQAGLSQGLFVACTKSTNTQPLVNIAHGGTGDGLDVSSGGLALALTSGVAANAPGMTLTGGTVSVLTVPPSPTADPGGLGVFCQGNSVKFKAHLTFTPLVASSTFTTTLDDGYNVSAANPPKQHASGYIYQVDIKFQRAMANAYYVVGISFESNAATAGSLTYIIANKTAAGFSVIVNVDLTVSTNVAMGITVV